MSATSSLINFELKQMIKNVLPLKIYETISFYRHYSKNKSKGIYEYFDEKTIEFLGAYPRFQDGEVTFLGKKLKFSHAPSLIHSIEELFCQKIYSFKSDNSSPLIIDCGSNWGLSIIFFKKAFPKAKIIAFEPDQHIFQILTENVNNFGLQDVELINKAVWDKNETLSFYQEGALAGSITSDFSNKGDKVTVEAVDILPYLNDAVEFLKIDIEGAENIVLEHISPGLLNVKTLFVEYHSSRNAPQELGKLLSILKDAGFRYYIKEADNLTETPFIHKFTSTYDLQLNIFCYR